ncbi:non-ribosomal peptide synthase/polyketide synthase [Xanthomonas translucens pv. undulosa]|uniref:non-ribosomal peptide synthase/polyketide synthase n=2 Tax=Xanthomonas campestris pv. translucens TaxID=343 RepID=UPI0019D71347|nr:non-ribosomal peptide synthase/polyketide synthase [Xanthomonas translucens]QSQ54055.1 non-ribosomal peptide synthase/polyketide synthase [Xanthomonas translucens pv. undulosa]QSQ60324.1 non-ribosomal peptide synthase/polyketide synthase [Xanthomonas translucens pv. undulosa]
MSSSKLPQDISTLTKEEANRLWALLSKAAPAADAQETIQPRNGDEAPPLSFAQQRLWFLAQLDAQADLAYLMPNGLRLRGRLDRHALRQALDRIVARHATLRTRIGLHQDQPVQIVDAADVGFRLCEHDLSACPDPEAQAQIHAEQETQTPFDLAHDTLARGQLLHLGEDDHVLLVTLHHLVSDGWSMGLLMHELTTLYAAFALGQPDPLPPLPLQYADIAVWQRGHITGQVLQRQRDFWLEHLRDAPALLDLPSDRPRPALQDYRGDTVGITLDADLTDALRRFSQRHGTTLFMTMLASWAVLLGRLSGQDQVVIGTPVANRTRSELEPLIGLFVNTQALCIDLRANPSIAQVLAQVRATALAAQDHQDLPFEQVIEAVSPERSLAYSPLFQVMLAWQSTPNAEPSLPGLRLSPIDKAVSDAKFDLDLSLHEADDRIVGGLCYATALFDRDTIERHVVLFVRMLHGMLADDQVRIAQLPLLRDEDRRQLLQQFNATTMALPAAGCVHDLFEAQARRTPDAIALVAGHSQLRYAELDALANRLAARLVALGIGPERRVAIRLERSPELIVALLAVLKAGGAYVPIDPAYPIERSVYLLEDSQACVLLTTTALEAELRFSDVLRTISVLLMDQPDASAQHDAALDTPAPAPAAYPQQPAYAIYTSGSSGQPKGVLVEHRQLCNLIHWHIARFGLQPGERCTSLAGLGFDAATWEIWPALCAGATLLLAPAAASADPGALLAWWRQQQMHSSFLPTPLAEIALREPGLPSTLRVLLTGGDRLGAIAQLPSVQLINNYGPTETTVVATSAQVTRASVLPGIGQPIANTRAYVLDAHGQLAPIDVVGELHLAGRQLARGYLGRPGPTAERFVPDPFAEQPGQRMYKTGDLVRWRADGSLDFLGRNDAQVKLRGVRIELGEIEAVLRACDGVREAVVLAREDSPGDTRLVAYLVGDATPGDAAICLGADRLRAQLATRLPDAMIPVAYVRLDALPLTTNGKLDRRALPLPDTDAFDVQAYAAPEGELETMLAALWSELLGVDQIGRHDSFFALGGHSLLGTRLISRIRRMLGLELPLAALFMQPRLAEMARAMDSLAASQLPAIVPLPREGDLPLSFAQQRLWFLAQLDAQADLAYAMPGGVELHGALDLAALRQALDRIVARHEALRTTFVASGDSAIQRIAPAEVGFALDCIDLRHAHDPDADAQRLAEQEANTPFDLEHGPLIRGRLLRLAEHRHRLLVTMHHIVTDGWSIGLLLRELGALYAAFVQGQPDPLPPLPIQYADYTLWQRRWLDGPLLQRQLDFWRDHLEGAPTLLALPTDHPRPALQDYRGDSVDLTLDADLTEALTALSQRHGTTLFMTVLAAWGALLARLSGQDEAVIGTPIANRTCSELEPLIGFFVNTQALRIDLRGNPSVAELLAQVRSTALVAQDHQDLPFEQVIEALNPARHLGHHPVFQAMLVWQNNVDVALDLPGLHSRVLEQDNATAKFDLQLTLQVQDAHIAGQLTYATALFERDTIERHLAQFVTLLHSMVADDHACVVQLPLLPDDEHAQLHGFNATATDLDGTGYLHRVIEVQAQRRPDAIAVTDDHGTLSYADLDARANQLAHHLIVLGVVPESSVAVCLPRSIDLVVALLAILKAGAAYLPLDSDVPAARLDTMLADARPRVLLAHRETAALLTPRDDRHTVLLDADAAWWATVSTQAPTVALLPQHPAYVIYTSGSTGTPKGVVNTHAAIDNRLLWMQQALRLQPEQRVLQKTPVGFDVSVWELFWPLRVGARLVLAEPGGHKDPAYLTDLIEQTGIDTVHFVPSMLRVFLETLPDGACATLQRIVCSGEALPADLAHATRERLPQARLYNLYGPTEAAVDVSVWQCTAADTHSVPIGRPIANTQLHVLDAQRQRSPIGVAGELQIAGVQLARGYLGRPDLTAERFVPDPFAEQPGQRMYRTGDVACWRANGALEYLGRNDHQVKLRGVRIELGEIEAALRACGVRETVVVVDGADNKRLIAYLVGDGAATDPTALRAQLAARLPEYMVPAAFVHMDALPLTPNGKLDRAALPAADTDALVANAYAAPEGELETLLATLWRELLDVPQVGRHDNFFALGGHSLLAVKLIERLRRLGWQLEVRALFGTPTVAGLANSLHSASQVVVPPNRIEADCSRITPDLLPLLELTQAEIDTVVANVDGGTANVQDIYPLAPLQEGLLFHHLADPLADPYLQSSLLAFSTSEQRVAFLDALDQVIARHDILRTGVVWQHLRVPVQVVWRQATLPRHVHVFDGPDRTTALQHWMHAPEAALRLQQAPLIHAHLADDPARGRWLLGLQHHHLAMDHTTLELLIEEVRAHLAGQQHQLPTPLPFRDFVAHTLAGVSAQEHQAFFTKMLGDIETPTAPFGVFAPVRDLESLQHLHQELPTTLAQAVRAQARRHGVTAASLFHLAYALLLARSSGRDEVVFGTVLFGRMHASVGVDRVLGMFLNTLPIRLGGRGHNVVQALHHTQQALARLFHHEHAPLALAQRCSAVEPTLPLLNAMLNYRYAGGSNVLGDEAHPHHDVLHEVQHIGAQERTHYPLAVSVDDRTADGGFSLDVQCVEQIGSERVAALLLQTVQALVNALEHAPETVLHALELLPAEERVRLQRFNTTATDLDGTGYLHHQIEVQAQRTPHAIALVEGQEELSYAALEASSNQLAHHLIALGVVPESRVAVCLPRSIDLIVALLAVLKAGAAYLPLDSDVPPARLDTMLADARPRVLLAHRETAALLAQCADRHSVLLDADAALWATTSTQAPTVALHPQHPAYVIYTSGSTGTPKGVVNTHAAIDNRLQWMQQELQLQPGQRVLQKTPVGFDVSVWELFWPLRVGARLVLAQPGGHKDPAYLTDLIEQNSIDTVHFVPSMLRVFLDVLPQGTCASLRRIVCSGEALPADLAHATRERLPNARLYNLYGPTEAAVDVSVWECTDADANGVPIGRPIANTRLHVLDAHGQLTPIGVAGELQIAGVQLARGYLGRPDLTAERFVPDPFAMQPGQRMYRTGDVARWRADGALDYLSRNDHQIKLRGVRIELGEIEAALRTCAGVRDAAVLLRQDNTNKPRLVAYVVGDTEVLAAATLRTQLAARLPHTMLPSAYVPLDALPLSANGKLDRRALPAPDADALATQTYVAPEGEREILLAALWSDLLGVEQVGRHDSFFALGGHSLLAVRLISRVRASLGLELPLATLFAHPRLADLAQALDSAAASTLPAIVPAERSAPLPLSFAQQRLWFLAQLDPQADLAYLMPNGLRLRGKLDRHALRQALDRIVARHESLRTRIALYQDDPVQIIAPATIGLRLREHDLSGHPEPETELLRLAEQETRTPFDLAHDTLARGQLLRLGEHEHILLVTLHHLVADGWSMGVLVHELGALYAAFAQGRPDPLPPLPIQYADYSLWQRRWLDGPLLQRQLDFWRDHLQDAPALLELPTDRPRPARPDSGGDTVECALDAELSAALTALSQRHGSTLFMTLLAAWGVLLARLSGQEQVVIGMPVANRTRSELEPLIGLFVNTQALRIDLRGEPSFAELLGQVRATALAAQAHQDVPFEQVIEALNPARNLAHHPLFQVMFAWQNTPSVALELHDLHLHSVQGPSPISKFDLELALHERDGTIVGTLGYATALFERSTVQRFLASFVHLLRAMSSHDHVPVARLPLLDAPQRQHLLAVFGTGPTVAMPAQSVHRLFEAQAQRTPDAIAVVADQQCVSYAALDARANRLAQRLLALGLRTGAQVAIALPRSIELIVAQLAVLKCAAVYVPLDCAHPRERLLALIADAQAQVLIQEPDGMLAPAGVTCLSLADLDDANTAAPPAIAVPATATAYVMYTSGSTGTPKGVAVSHAAVLAFALSQQHAPLQPQDRVAFLANPAFDASTFEIWATLLHGAAIVVVDQQTLLDPNALARYLTASEVSILHLTAGLLPGYWQAMRTFLPTLRCLLTGGDSVDAGTIAAILAQAAPQRLLHCYGPTETTTFSVVHPVATVAADAARIPLGRPLPGSRAYVLDRHGQPVPIGVAGEVHIAGVQLAQGYLHRPDLTAERFVPDPFAEQAGERMYRTGDLARWCDDGLLESLGRNDDQIKLRGFRIELGEIQAALRACDGIREAVVIARQDSPGEQRLVAYLVGDGAAPSPEALRTQLGLRLPDYMVPSAYVRLDALPLTANGKLDRRALPAPDASALALQTYLAPEGELEILLAGLWSELLGVEQIGRHDSFFALGGHSLLAVRLISRIRSALGVELPLATLFTQPCLADIAIALRSAVASTLPAIVPVQREGTLSLSFAQQRLWFLSQLDARAAQAYLLAGGVDLHGELDLPALQRALDRIVARHEALRTSFVSIDDGATQIIAPPDIGFALHCIDLRQSADPYADAQRHAEQEASTAFDLEHGPLIRGRLLRLDAHEHRLLLTMHHIVTDGWSMGLLVRELSTLYAAFALGQPDPLPPLPIQYADYAQWQRCWLEGPLLQRQLSFWREHLQGAPALLELPTDRPRPALQDYSGDSIEIALDAELTSALRALSQRHGSTVFMTVLAAWSVLLSRLSGQDEVVIGAPVANRTRSELEALIGFFVNAQALRIDLSANPSVAELLAQVRNTALAAQDHQDLPFEQVIEALNPERSLASQPVFQVVLTWQNVPEADLTLPGLRLQPIQAQARDAKFDLELFLGEVGDRIVGSLNYATALFDRGTIERQLAQFVQLLAGMAADAQARIAQLPLLPADERAQLHNFTATETAPPAQATCIHHLFENQVRRTPDAIALLDGDVQLSYAALDARANQLAHRLHKLGVGPESRVALYLPRGIDQVVALLAVLKAGAAYLPLDPELPSERLAFLLEDSRPRAVLTCTELQDRLPASRAMLRVSVLTLDTDMDVGADDPGAPMVPGLCPDNLAYVIYTSGSTGQPKGTLLTHAGAAHYLQWAIATYRPFPSAVVSSSLAFDATLTSLLAPLLCGARVELLPEHDTLDALRQRLCDPSPLGLVKLTPAHLEVLGQQLTDHPGPLSPAVMVIGGEALPAATLARWQTLAPHTRLINEYGPTETVVGCVVHDTTSEDALDPSGRVPIGQPIAHLRIHVLDAHGQLAPIGVSGHLHIAGPQLARGYLGRPDLTAERFVPDPFAEQPGQRMYRSGDLACWRADGTLDFLGRNDDQVKLRGFRIELSEIAAALRACPGVHDAVVLLREDTPGEPHLVAYLVTEQPEQAEPSALRDTLATRLPEVMLPTAYVRLDALPLTANGKLDRRALPAADADALAVQAYAPPEGELETLLAALWGELLGVERIGRHDSFFALGGHSLLGVRLISRIRSTLGLELPLAALFAQPRLAELAQVLGEASATALPPILPMPRTAPMPLSFAQQRLWFLNQLDPRTGATYIMHRGVRLSGSLHVQALTRALDRIVARHETLRTHFASVDDIPVQIIAAPCELALQRIDLSSDPAPESAARLHALSEASTGFDLANGPLVRGRLLRLAEDEHVLLLSMHHIVSDGWSIGVVIEELGALYAAFVGDAPDPLPPLPIQYADYAAWQHRWIDSQLQQKQLDFWRTHLRDAPALLELPTDRPRPPLQDTSGDDVELILDEHLSMRLQALAVQHGVTIFGLLLSAWAALLARYSGQTDLVIGTPSAGRNRSELEPLIGFFVNTLPLRIDLSARPTFLELLDQVQTKLLAAQAHQDLPFERIIEAVRPVRSLAHTPLCQTMFSADTTPASALDLPDLQLSAYPSEHCVAQFDLSLEMQIAPSRIGGVLRYATALFDRSTMQAYLHNYARLLAALADAPTLAVDRQALLDATEWRALQQWNGTVRALQTPTTIHTAFQAQARITPDAIAVIDGARSLRYAELDAHSDRIAMHLSAAGVRTGDCVVTLLPRSAELVAAQLGILKAGAAYVPLDPRQPAARHAQLAGDCQARAIVHAAGEAPPWSAAPCLEIALAGQPTAAFAAPPLPAAAPAYVMYTSGSSGSPKGVLVPHQAVLNLVRDPDYARWQADDRFAFASNPAFDSSTLEVWAPLLSGGSVVVVPQEVMLDPSVLAQFVRTHAISVLILVAGVLRAYATELARELPTLRYLITGGDIADPQALATLLRDTPPQTLLQTYGPTETTQFATAVAVTDVPADGQRIPIGKPIGNLRLYVLDRHRQALPVGMQGELHIAGLALALGYLRQPALTAEQFVPDPFSGEPGARMYRTGDLGRWRADGLLECLGRRDAQSKIRGFRLEPGEIEAALHTHPQVDQALVRVRDDTAGQRRLVAYVIGSQNDAMTAHDPDELRRHLAATLPDYMLPDAYVGMQAWPLTANGKVDVRALPAPDDTQRGIAEADPAQGATECALAQIWCELLGVGMVNRHDNFFDIGGHSLLAVQLATRIQARLGRRLPLSRLFAEPTLARMAAALADSAAASSAPIAALVDRSSYYE